MFTHFGLDYNLSNQEILIIHLYAMVINIYICTGRRLLTKRSAAVLRERERERDDRHRLFLLFIKISRKTKNIEIRVALMDLKRQL